MGQVRAEPAAADWRTIWLLLDTRKASPAELAVRFTADQQVSDLTRALASYATERAGDRIALSDGQLLDPLTPIVDAPIRMGDLVRLVDERYRPAVSLVASLELRVVAGPNAGLGFRLQDGTQTLGRGQCDLQIPDDLAISRLHAQISVRDGEVFIDQITGRNGIWRAGAPIAAPFHVQLGEALEAGNSRFIVAAMPSYYRPAGRGGTLLFANRLRQGTASSGDPDPCELADRAKFCLSTLWERRLEHEDFLRLRIGWDAQHGPGQTAAARPSAPAAIDLANHSVLAVSGDEAGRIGLARWLTIQAAVLHRPGDLRIAALLSGHRLDDWAWLKWLPHTVPLPEGTHRSIVAANSLTDLGSDIEAAVAGRTHLLLLVEEGSHGADSFLDQARRSSAADRVHLVWLAARAPMDARPAVHIEPVTKGRARVRMPGFADLEGVIADAVSVTYATSVARDLAGIEELPRPAVDSRPGDGNGSIVVEPLGFSGQASGGLDLKGIHPKPMIATPAGKRTSRHLKITVKGGGGPARDVAVDVDSDKNVAELTAALAAHLELTGSPLSLRHRRSGRLLSPTALVHLCGIRTGDMVVLEPEQTIDGWPQTVAGPQDEFGRIPFNRPPRLMHTSPAATFRLDAPPQPRPTSGQVLRPLLPVGIGLVLGIAVGLVTYFTGGKQIALLLFVVLGPMMGIVSAIFPLADVIGRRRAYRRESAEFRDRLSELRISISTALKAEDDRLSVAAPEPRRLGAWAEALDPRLWERDPDDPDWLRLRAGLTSVESGLRVEIAEGGDPKLRSEAEQIVSGHRMLEGVPLLIDLAEAGTLGLSGDPVGVESVARWLVLQIAALHSPRDVVIAAAVPAGDRHRWEWLSWLPHVHSETAPLPGQLVVSDLDPAAPAALLKRLLTLLGERRNAGASLQASPAVVLLVHEDVHLAPGDAAHLLLNGPTQRIHTIWIGRRWDTLPRGCGGLLEIVPERGITLIHPTGGGSASGPTEAGVTLELATAVARALASLRDPTAPGAQVGVPAAVSLAELLELREDPEARIQSAWECDLAIDGDRRDLSAPLGMAAGGRQFSVSVRRDGPHGLIGGMTGAGKSELLQTLVAALAARHSPQSLNFLLVDYKGGAAFKDCVDLPHTVGFVTDLDGHLVNRSLVSMRAELARRERLQREAGVKDLEEFEQLHPDMAPPSLIIIVDEFAALATELPEFVDGMVDIAQRGRSLGIHLILATQRPAGVIGPKIRANTPLRLSLRFKDDSDSEDVLKAKDAARPGLPPGRAFTVTSSGELIEFQTGYAGAETLASQGPTPIRVRDLEFGGVPIAEPGTRTASARVESDLNRLVRAMTEVNRRLDLAPPRRPWLPALPTLISLGALPAVQGWQGPTATIGLLDDPSAQSQTPLSFPLQEVGSLLVYGSSGSGKTTLLRTLALSVAETTSPSALNFYVLDFATRLLGSLDALPHCGGVIMGDEVARAAKLMAWLLQETERRRVLLGAAAAPTLSEYLAAKPAVRPPHVLVLIDGYPGFASTLENVDRGTPVDAFKTLLTTGPPLGIAFVVTADRLEKGVANLRVGRRLVLSASQDDYATFSLPRSLYERGELNPGRGYTFTANPRTALEVQCALVGPDPAGPAQATAIAAAGAELTERHGSTTVPRIETLPTKLRAESLPAPGSSLEAIVGLRENEDDTLGPARVDLDEGHFVVIGPAGSGRTNALGAFASSLLMVDEPPVTHLLTARLQHALADRGLWTSVALGQDACEELLARLVAEAGETSSGKAQAHVLFLDDCEDVVGGMSLSDLDWLARDGAALGFRIVIAIEAQKELTCRTWVTQVARARHCLVFEPVFGADGSLVGQPTVKLPVSRTPLPRGRGYLIMGGHFEVVQVALADG